MSEIGIGSHVVYTGGGTLENFLLYTGGGTLENVLLDRLRSISIVISDPIEDVDGLYVWVADWYSGYKNRPDVELELIDDLTLDPRWGEDPPVSSAYMQEHGQHWVRLSNPGGPHWEVRGTGAIL